MDASPRAFQESLLAGEARTTGSIHAKSTRFKFLHRQHRIARARIVGLRQLACGEYTYRYTTDRSDAPTKINYQRAAAIAVHTIKEKRIGAYMMLLKPASSLVLPYCPYRSQKMNTYSIWLSKKVPRKGNSHPDNNFELLY